MRKLCAFLTATCFSISVVCGEVISVMVTEGPVHHFKHDAGDELVPVGAGRITEWMQFDDGPLVIHILDLHCNSAVQRNIARIISALDERFSLRHVYVEGGYGDIDTSWLNTISDEAARTEIRNQLVDAGRLSGAEYYSMTAGRFGLLKGVEDPSLHKENIVRLGHLLSLQSRFDDAAKEMNRGLEMLKSRYWGMQNKRLDRMISAYRAGHLSSSRYYRQLEKYIEKINENPAGYNNPYPINLAQYPAIVARIEMSDLERHVNYQRANQQLIVLIEELKVQLSYTDFCALLNETDNFSDKYALCEQVRRIDQELHFNVRKRFPDLFRYLRVMELGRDINSVELVRQEQQIVEDLRFACSRSAAEREIAFLADFFGTFLDYLSVRLSAEDYAYFSMRFEKFKHIISRYLTPESMADMAKYFSALDAYYAANIRRNTVFVDALFRDAGTGPAGRDVFVLVTGGFHADGVGRMLAEKKISYITVTPETGSTSSQGATVFNEQVTRQSRLFSSQGLSLTLPSCLANTKVLEAGGDKIVLEINGADDRLIFVRVDGAWKLLPDANLWPETGKYLASDMAQKISDAVNEAAALAAAISPDRIGYTIDLINALVKTLGIWGTYRGLWGGNGLIWRIAVNENVYDVLRNRIDIIAMLPDMLQNAELYDAQQSLAIRQLNGPVAVLAPILEMSGMYELWRAVNKRPDTPADDAISGNKQPAGQYLKIHQRNSNQELLSWGGIVSQLEKYLRSTDDNKLEVVRRYFDRISREGLVDNESAQRVFEFILQKIVSTDDSLWMNAYLYGLSVIFLHPSQAALRDDPENRARAKQVLEKAIDTIVGKTMYVDDEAISALSSVLEIVGDRMSVEHLMRLTWLICNNEDGIKSIALAAFRINPAAATGQWLEALNGLSRNDSSQNKLHAQAAAFIAVTALSAVAEAGVPIDSAAVAASLMRIMQSGAPLRMRASAASTLLVLETDSVEPRLFLQSMLRSSVGTVSARALWVLKRIRDPHALLETIRRNRGLPDGAGEVLLEFIDAGLTRALCAALTEMSEVDIDQHNSVAQTLYDWGIEALAGERDPGVRHGLLVLLRSIGDNALKYDRPLKLSSPDGDIRVVVEGAIETACDPARPAEDRLLALQVAEDMNDATALEYVSDAIAALFTDANAPYQVRVHAARLLGRTGAGQIDLMLRMARSADRKDRDCGVAGLLSVMLSDPGNITIPDDIRRILLLFSRDNDRDTALDAAIVIALLREETDEVSFKTHVMDTNPDPKVRIAAIEALGAMTPALAAPGVSQLFDSAGADRIPAVRRVAVSALVRLMSADESGSIASALKNISEVKVWVYKKIAHEAVSTGNQAVIAGVIRCFASSDMADPAVMTALQLILGSKKLSDRRNLIAYAGIVMPYVRSADPRVVYSAENVISCACDDPQVLARVAELGAEGETQLAFLHIISMAELSFPGISKQYEHILQRLYMSPTKKIRRLAAVMLVHLEYASSPAESGKGLFLKAAACGRALTGALGRLVKHRATDDLLLDECLRSLTDDTPASLSLILPLLEPALPAIIRSKPRLDVESVVGRLSAIADGSDTRATPKTSQYAAKLLLSLADIIEEPRHPVLKSLKYFPGISGNTYSNNEPQKVTYVLTVAAPLMRLLGYDATPKELKALLQNLVKLERDISLVDDGADLKIFLNDSFRQEVVSVLRGVPPAYKALYENDIGLYGLAIAVARTAKRYGMPDNDDAVRRAVGIVCQAILAHWDHPVLDGETVFCAIYHNENSYQTYTARAMIGLMADAGILPRRRVLIRKTDATAALEELRNILIDSRGSAMFVHISGHGTPGKLWLSDQVSSYIPVHDLAATLRSAAEAGVDLSRITIVFDSCYSHDSAVKCFNELRGELSAHGSSAFPYIISAANRNVNSYRMVQEQISMWEGGLREYFRAVSRSGKITIGDVIQAGISHTRLVDSTVFVPSVGDMGLAPVDSVVPPVLSRLSGEAGTSSQISVAGAEESTIVEIDDQLDPAARVLEVNMRPSHLARIIVGAATALGLAATVVFGGVPLVALPAGMVAVGMVLAAVSPIAGLELIRLAVWAGARFGFLRGGARVKSIDLGGTVMIVPGTAAGVSPAFVAADPEAAAIRITPSHFFVLSVLNARPLTRALMKLSLYTTGTIGHEVYHILYPTGGEQRAFAYGQMLPAIFGFLLGAGGAALFGLAGVPVLLIGLFIGAPVVISVVGILLKSVVKERARPVAGVTIAWLAADEQGQAHDAVLTPTGRGATVVCPVLVTAVRPRGWDAMCADIVNLGTTEQGTLIWGGLDKGNVVVHSEDADMAAIAAAVNSRLKDDRHVQSSMRALLSASVGGVGLDFSYAAFSDGVYFRTQQQPGPASLAYDLQGNVILTLDTTDSRQFEAVVLSARAIRSGDTYAMARSILLHLDTEYDPERNIQTILNMRGQQLLVDGFERAREIRVMMDTIERDHRVSLGIRVFALTSALPADAESIQGLAGYVLKNDDGMTLFGADTPQSGVEAGMIRADSVAAIEAALRDARYPIRIISAGTITAAVVKDRDFLDKAGLTQLLGSGMRAFFGSPVYNERYIRDAVYAFDSDACARPETGELFLGAMRSSVPPSVYARLASVFRVSVEERAQAERWLQDTPVVGSMPLRHKQMLGRALSLSAGRPIQQPEIAVFVTEGQIEAAHQAVIASPTPAAIGALIGLIQAFDRQSPVVDPGRFRMEPADTARVAAILSAA